MKRVCIFVRSSMPKILFIAAHRPERSPSQRYRFEQYFSFLRANGYSCELSYIIDEEADAIFYAPGKFVRKSIITLNSIVQRFSDIKKARGADIVFVQREAFMTGSAFFEKQFKKTGAKLVFDFDDSIWLLDTSEANKRWEWLKSEKKTGKLIALADLVFAGNDYLADYASRFSEHVMVIPTTIDTQLFQRNTPYVESEKVCIGWSGSITTVKHFDMAVPVLKRIKEKYGERVEFKIMGDRRHVCEDLQLKAIPWSVDAEVSVLSSFDIGIMPLPDDEWVKGKCGLKGLSYMALEIPTIMSAVGVNPSIIQDGQNGYLAAGEEEWFEKLSALIDSFELRKRMGAAGRQTVEQRYSVESQKMNYLDSFNALLKR